MRKIYKKGTKRERIQAVMNDKKLIHDKMAARERPTN